MFVFLLSFDQLRITGSTIFSVGESSLTPVKRNVLTSSLSSCRNVSSASGTYELQCLWSDVVVISGSVATCATFPEGPPDASRFVSCLTGLTSCLVIIPQVTPMQSPPAASIYTNVIGMQTFPIATYVIQNFIPSPSLTYNFQFV